MASSAQSSLKAWLTAKEDVTQLRAEREAAERRVEEQRAADCARVGLAWPRSAVSKKKRDPGRPPLQELYEEELYRLILRNQLPASVTHDVPRSWSPGCDLNEPDLALLCCRRPATPATQQRQQSTSAGSGDAGEALAQESGHAVDRPTSKRGRVQDEHVEAAQEPGTEHTASRKRKKVHFPLEVRQWFVEFAELQSQREGWSMARSLCEATNLAPDLFSHINPETPRGWQNSQKPPAGNPGRPNKLTDAVRSVLAKLAKDVSVCLPCASPLLTVLFNQQLTKLGIETEVSLSWTRRFLIALGFGVKQFGEQESRTITEQDARDARDNMMMKVLFMGHG